jgi:hypothetical protein
VVIFIIHHADKEQNTSVPYNVPSYVHAALKHERTAICTVDTVGYWASPTHFDAPFYVPQVGSERYYVACQAAVSKSCSFWHVGKTKITVQKM